MTMGCKHGQFPFQYLGLPLSNKKLHTPDFHPLIKKFNDRLSGWTAKNLSIAARLTLINAVLSSLPTYYMACFQIPSSVIKEIDKIRRHFLWHGVTQERKKLNLVNWELVCMPKKSGGLGVTDLMVFNQAMLAKWCWQWISAKQKLWKIIVSTTSGDQHINPNTTLFSQTLNHASQFVLTSTKREPVSGLGIDLWHDDWGIGRLNQRFEILHTFVINDRTTLARVTQIHNIASEFKENLSEQAQEELQQLIELLTSNPITLQPGSDSAIWLWEKSGQFTVKSTYCALKNTPTIGTYAHRLWKLAVPQRIQIFAYLMYLNRLLTVDNLMKRGWQIANRCIMCQTASESVQHLFIQCKMATRVYTEVNRALNINMPIRDIINVLVCKQHAKSIKETLLISQFIIWRERCAQIFTDKQKLIQQLVQEVHDQRALS